MERPPGEHNRTAAWVLAVLTLINLFNYLDRYLIAALVTSLEAPSGLGIDDVQAGWLQSGFLIVYMCASPVFGAYGDRAARPRLIAIGVFVWSLATALGGLAVGFVSLFAARALVGVGEAAYGTISPGIIADLYPRERRARVMAIFFAAIPVGSALGYVIGGLVDKAAGWRAAFFVAGVPGMALAFLCARLPDPPRGAHDRDAAPAAGSLRATYARLVRNRPYVMTVLGYALYTFALGGLAFWMPTFLHRERGADLATATTIFGGILVFTGFIGTFVGGWLGDRLRVRLGERAYLWLSGLATLLAAPFALAALVSPEPVAYYSGIVIAELLLFASTGPINSVIVNVVAPGERATAVAVSIFTIHLLGDVPSPPLIGQISKASSLGTAVLIVPVAIALSGLVWLLSAPRRTAPS
jgi:MFS family permease